MTGAAPGDSILEKPTHGGTSCFASGFQGQEAAPRGLGGGLENSDALHGGGGLGGWPQPPNRSPPPPSSCTSPPSSPRASRKTGRIYLTSVASCRTGRKMLQSQVGSVTRRRRLLLGTCCITNILHERQGRVTELGQLTQSN